MDRIERIKKILKKNLEPTHLILNDKSKKHSGHNDFDGSGITHLYLEISSIFFKNKKLIDIHRRINLLIKDEYQKGLHAIEIKIIKH